LHSDKVEKLRSATLGKTREFVKELVEIDGCQFELRQPTVKARSRIFDRSVDSGTGKHDPFAIMLWGIIECTYCPESGERVFTDHDYEALASTPVGGYVDELGKSVMTLFNIDVDIKKNT
jgi:hypothetical protein